MLLLLGAQINLIPHVSRMLGAIDKLKGLVAAIPNSIFLQQYDNPGNPEIHRNTKVEEIWSDTVGYVDAQVSGIGANFTAKNLNTDLIGEVLKIVNPTAFFIAPKVTRLERIACGISLGSALEAALEFTEQTEMVGENIITISQSFAERHLSTHLYDGFG